MLTMAIPNNSL